MLFPNAFPILDDFGRADGAVGANWTVSDFSGPLIISGGRAGTGVATPTDAGGAWKVPFAPLEAMYVQFAALPVNLGSAGVKASQDPFENYAETQLDLLSTGGGTWALRIMTGDDTQQVATSFVTGDWMALTINQVTGLNTGWRLPAAGGPWASVVTAAMPSLKNGTQGWYALLHGNDSQVRFGPFGAQTSPGTDPTLNLPLVHGRGAC